MMNFIHNILFSVIIIISISKIESSAESDDFQNYKKPPFFENRNVIVHLQDMLYSDIEFECQHFLSLETYAAVQVSPVTEFQWFENHPWDERMYVSSYKINNASGNEEEFIKMVNTCNQQNVRVLVDIAINNMGTKEVKTECPVCGRETSFGPDFFHKACKLEFWNYRNSRQTVLECQIDEKRDLIQVKKNGMINWKIVQFLTRLINIGVAGFRILLADHMDPNHLLRIYNSLPDLQFAPGTRPFIYHDVYNPLHGNMWVIKDDLYAKNTRVTDYSFTVLLTNLFLLWRKGYSFEGYEGWSKKYALLPSSDVVVFNFNFQTRAERTNTLTPHPKLENFSFLDSSNDKAYKLSTLFLLTQFHGIVLLTSTPKSNNKKAPNYKNNRITPFKASKMKIDEWDKSEWNGEHRWSEIYRLVEFHNSLRKGVTEEKLPKVNNWFAWDKHLVAYCLDDKAFVVINSSGDSFRKPLTTCFNQNGYYCDIITGGKNPNKNECFGDVIVVTQKQAFIVGSGYVGMMLFHYQHMYQILYY
ncbi:alpha-amylase-related protein-like [Lycorma delicatula]|uniref:alpha-amylase-related protein-like n=1 Tax=Lycorma delicatula TaxID=130591 RepID=UPI003F51338F